MLAPPRHPPPDSVVDAALRGVRAVRLGPWAAAHPLLIGDTAEWSGARRQPTTIYPTAPRTFADRERASSATQHNATQRHSPLSCGIDDSTTAHSAAAPPWPRATSTLTAPASLAPPSLSRDAARSQPLFAAPCESVPSLSCDERPPALGQRRQRRGGAQDEQVPEAGEDRRGHLRSAAGYPPLPHTPSTHAAPSLTVRAVACLCCARHRCV